jgi:hypothetical protein
VICKNVVSLPNLLGCHLILRFIVTKTANIPKEKRNSLLTITTSTQTGNMGPDHSLSEESKKQAISKSSLSAAGSRYLPKVVVSPLFRARYPSKTSLKPITINTPNAMYL